jgi:hypothetical protein
VVEVPDLGAAVEVLRARDVRFRHEIVSAVGVRQALLEDPSGNPVELFEPLAGYHERGPRAGKERPAPNLSTGEREDRR